MAVTKDKSAPYSPTRAITTVLDRNRSRGLPSPITPEVLTQTGISDSLNSRTLQALNVLDLIDEEGRHTETLKALRLAPESDYKQRMAEWLNAAYAEVLAFVDPATDDDTKIRDAFRPYNPTGQQDRMVSLFTGLYTEAGVRPENVSGSAKSERTPRQRAKTKPATTKRTPAPEHDGSAGGGARYIAPNQLPPAITGLLSSLPPQNEGWTKDRRDQFMTAFGVILDFCYPIRETRGNDSKYDVESETADD